MDDSDEYDKSSDDDEFSSRSLHGKSIYYGGRVGAYDDEDDDLENPRRSKKTDDYFMNHESKYSSNKLTYEQNLLA